LSRAKMVLAVAFVAALLMVVMAAPAFAFIHDFIPAGDCATSEQAGDNETAEENIPRNPIAQPPAPDDCPAPQK
jgi:hypothetical protein